MTPSRPRVRHLALVLASALVAVCPSAAHALGTLPMSSGYVTDGEVNATATDASGRTYVGGDFSSVGPLTGSVYMADQLSGESANYLPQTDGTINVIVGNGDLGWYLGGSFSTVGGVKRQNLAYVRRNGTVDPNWNPAPNGPVNSIAVQGDIFVGGAFTSIGGVPRTNLARVDGVGHVSTTWIPDATATSIDVLEVEGSKLYVGGTSLSSIASQACAGLCRLSTTTPTASTAVDQTWQITPGVSGTSVKALVFSGDSAYVGGRFTAIGGQPRNGLAKVSLSTAVVDPSWDPQPDMGGLEEIRALETVNSSLWVGGRFDTIDGQPITNLAQVSLSGTGDVDTTWTPDTINGPVNALITTVPELFVVGEFTSVGSQERRYAAKFRTTPGLDADLLDWQPRFNAPAKAVQYGGTGLIVIGGEFTSAGLKTLERQNVARFDAAGRLDPTWDPSAGGSVYSLAADANSVYIGGSLTSINHHGTGDVAKVSQSGTGTHDATWAPTVGTVPGLSRVTALALKGNDVFIGQGHPLGADNFSADTLIKVSGSGTGVEDTTWNPDVQGAVRALQVSGDDLIVGGEFTGVVGGQARDYLAKVATTGTGAADATWNPAPDAPVRALAKSGDDLYLGGDFNNVGGSVRTKAAKVSLSGAGTLNPDWGVPLNGAVRAVAVTGGQVYLGGNFTTVGGENVRRLARFSATGAAVIDATFTPNPLLPVRTLLGTPTRLVAGGQFPALSDRDSGGLAFFDLAAPTITLTMPGDGPRPAIAWTEGSAIAADYACDDDSGVIVRCDGTRPFGAALNTSVGTHTFTVTATDASGNLTTKSTSYTVVALPKPPPPVDDVKDTKDTKDTGGGGVIPPNTPVAPKDLTAPLLSTSPLTPKSFKAAKSGASTVTAAGKKPKAGTRISLTLSEASTVKGTVIVPKKGKTKAKTVGSFSQAVLAGKSSFDFTGRVAGKKLKAGKYTLELVATDGAGNASKVATLTFTIKR